MSGELAFKKLADVSIADLFVEVPEQTLPEIRMAVGRMYAKIHRSSPMMPQSLQMSENKPTTAVSVESQDLYVIPKTR